MMEYIRGTEMTGRYKDLDSPLSSIRVKMSLSSLCTYILALIIIIPNSYFIGIPGKGNYGMKREFLSHTVGILPLYTCLRSSDGRILIKRKKVTPSLPHQGVCSGHSLFACSQCGDFRISKFYSVISPHSTLPLAV